MRRFKIFLLFIINVTFSWFALFGQTGDKVTVTATNLGPWAQANSEQFVYGVLFNDNNETITSLAVLWQVNHGEVRSIHLNDLYFVGGGDLLFYSGSPWAIGNEGMYSIKLWVDLINGTPQENADTLFVNVEALGQSAPRTFIYESFSSTGCGTCAGINPVITSLSNKYSTSSFFISYQTDCFTSNPMCLYASEFINEIKNLYSVTYTPYTVFGHWYKGNSHSFSHELIYGELERPSPIDINGHFEVNNGEVNIDFTVTPFTEIPSQNLIIRVAITQGVVSFDSPPGSNGETEFFNVLRRFAQTESISLSNLSEGLPIHVNLTEFFDDTQIDMSMLKVGVFIQDLSNFSFIQGAKLSPVPTSVNQISESKPLLYPNPSIESTQLTFKPNVVGNYNIKVINTLGGLVYSKVIQCNTLNELEVLVPTMNLPSGFYTVLVLGPRLIANQKLIVN